MNLPFGEWAALFDPDDRAAHNVFDGDKVGRFVGSHEFLYDIRIL